MIILAGILLGLAAYFFFELRPVKFTATSKAYPMNASTGGQITSGLSSLLGEGSSNFTNEASINIIDLATSISLSQEIAMSKLPGHGNMTIGETYIRLYNKHKLPWEENIKIPTDPAKLAITGGRMVRSNVFVSITKNGMLQTDVTSTDPTMITPMNYLFLDLISKYYRDLKVSKAQLDFEFSKAKLDSINRVLKMIDAEAIRLNNTTRFVPDDKLEYYIPKENLLTDKSILMSMRGAALNNVEYALWRIQKESPLIKILDYPEPPYSVNRPQSGMMGIVAGLGGLFLALLIAIMDIFGRLIKSSINGFFTDEEGDNDEPVATATKNVEEVVYNQGSEASTVTTGYHQTTS